MSEDYEADAVGYKHPPRANQFRPGQSGNPSGRPKGTRNFRSELREELGELITVRDGDREIQLSKQRALIKSLVGAAIDGNQRAAASVLTMCVRMLADAEDDEAIEGEDQEIVEAFTKRKKRAAAAGGKSMRQDLKRLLRGDLLSFARKALTETSGETMPENRYLELLAGRLADLVTGDSKRLIVNLPPRHFKTWIGSICLSAWILGHHPSAKILMLTYGQELADKIARAIRAIMRSAWYKELFKKTRLASSKLDDFATTAGGAVRSVSMEGGVTGYGADYIIVDDPTELKDCDNVKRLERVVDLFETEILTRLNNPRRGRVVIIAHRVNEDDLSGHLLEQGGRWRHLKLPLIAMRRRKHKLPDGEIWVREKGELLRPDAFSPRLFQAPRGGPGSRRCISKTPAGQSSALSRSTLGLSRPRACRCPIPAWY
jgi:hypothetical protein